jgi:hypothetical protein
MHGTAGNIRAAGVLKPGVMRMYKVLHIVVIYVVYKRSDTNGLSNGIITQ